MSQSLRNPLTLRACFWSLLAVQVAGVIVILCAGLPVYWHLLADQYGSTTPAEFIAAGVSVAAMQLAYWFAYPLQRRLRFRKNVLLGHLLLWLGELSYFFPHALAALIVFDRFKELEELRFAPERMLMLTAILFAVYCFKHQLESLGDTILGEESETASA